MNFGRRLRFYILGVLLGCLLVFGIFNQRLNILTDWLPGNRVLGLIQNSEALYTEEARCQLACFDLDSTDVENVKSFGSVRFKMSETHGDPKKYVVDLKSGAQKMRMTFSISDSLATLIKVEMPEKVVICDCD